MADLSVPLVHTVTIYGASDDLVEVEGPIPGADEYGAYGDDSWTATIKSEASGESMLVHARYMKTGTWLVGVAQTDEDQPFPSRWVSDIRSGGVHLPTYSTGLVLIVPADAVLEVTQ